MLSRNAEPFFVPAVSVVSAQASLLTMDLGNAARQCQLGLDEGTDRLRQRLHQSGQCPESEIPERKWLHRSPQIRAELLFVALPPFADACEVRGDAALE